MRNCGCVPGTQWIRETRYARAAPKGVLILVYQQVRGKYCKSCTSWPSRERDRERETERERQREWVWVPRLHMWNYEITRVTESHWIHSKESKRVCVCVCAYMFACMPLPFVCVTFKSGMWYSYLYKSLPVLPPLPPSWPPTFWWVRRAGYGTRNTRSDMTDSKSITSLDMCSVQFHSQFCFTSIEFLLANRYPTWN